MGGDGEKGELTDSYCCNLLKRIKLDFLKTSHICDNIKMYVQWNMLKLCAYKDRIMRSKIIRIIILIIIEIL